jgi:hypothetical protein
MCTVSQKRPFTVESSDEDDLLKHLDIAYRREQWRARKRRSRLRKEDMNSKHERCLEPVSSEDQARCMNYLQEALGAEGLDETTCGVCDRLVIGRDAVRKEGSDWRFMNVLRELLGVASSDIPQRLVDQYCAPPHIEGIHCYIDKSGCPSAWMSICSDCMSAIRSRQLPKFAIANGFFVGRLPAHLNGLVQANGG